MKNKIPTETLVEEGTAHEAILLEHPAFGMVSISRVQSGSGQNRLFGSDLNHSNTVTLCVHEASAKRYLNQEWHSAEKMVCEIEMSHAQFSRMVASVGVGNGTPCTIRHQQVGDLTEQPRIDKPAQSRSALHVEEMEAGMRKSLEGIQEVLRQVQGLAASSGAVSKKDLKDLVSQALRLGEQLPGNLAFAQKQFREAMETTVQDSKTEIEIFVNSMDRRVGPGVLNGQFSTPGIEDMSGAAFPDKSR